MCKKIDSVVVRDTYMNFVCVSSSKKVKWVLYYNALFYTQKCFVPLTCIHIISNWSSFWKIANRKILLDLQGYILIQHNRTFTYSCKHGYHVRRTRNNSKRHSFWRLTWLLLCVYLNHCLKEQVLGFYSKLLWGFSVHLSL